MSETRSLWGLRFLALALAVLAWVVINGERLDPQSEKVIETAVRYDTPQGFLLLERVEQVRVVVRGGESRLRTLNPLQVDVFVSVPGEVGTVDIPLELDQVVLPEGLQVVSIEPNVLTLSLDRAVVDIVDIRPRLTGEPAAGAIVRSARAIPNQAQVQGPASRIENLEYVETTPVDLNTHAFDFETQAVVLPPDAMTRVLEPRIITVAVDLEIPGIQSEESNPPAAAPGAGTPPPQGPAASSNSPGTSTESPGPAPPQPSREPGAHNSPGTPTAPNSPGTSRPGAASARQVASVAAEQP